MAQNLDLFPIGNCLASALVDREGRWQELRPQLGPWQARAAEAEVPLVDAMPDLKL